MIIPKEVLMWVLAILTIIIIAVVLVQGGLVDAGDKVTALFSQFTP
jgi:hypothetical protein